MSTSVIQDTVSDSIRKFGKSKGYESLPRELLQSTELPLEAIGLLCNLQSYPDNWILRKTELRKRFTNSEKAVDRVWDILVEKGYILQFRRREGKRYVYQYFFNVEKFTLAEVQELLPAMFEQGMLLYHKSIKKGIDSPDELKDVLSLSQDDKDKLDLSFWTSQKRNSKKDDDTNDSWTSQNGKSKMEIPNAEDSRFTNNRFITNKLTSSKEEEEDNKIKGKRETHGEPTSSQNETGSFQNEITPNQNATTLPETTSETIGSKNLGAEDEEANKIKGKGELQTEKANANQAIFEAATAYAINDRRLQATMKYLFQQGVDLDDISPIIVFLGENPNYIQQNLIEQQSERNRRIGSTEGLFSYPDYFINGLVRFGKNINLDSNREIEERYREAINPLPRVSLFNWVTGEGWDPQ